MQKSQQVSDGDFGGSPTLFGPDIGACNKNGIYYVMNQTTMQEVWERQIGAKSNNQNQAECVAAADYDGTNLYMAGPAATVGGTAYRGSIMSLNPSTGAIQWQTGLPAGVDSSPGMNGGGVISVGTFDSGSSANGEFLVNASDGAIISNPLISGFDFPQGVFAGGWLYTANGSGVYGWQLPA